MNKLASLLLFAGGAAFALAARRDSRGADRGGAPKSDEVTPTPPPSTATMQSAPDVTMTPVPTPSL